MVFNWLNAVLVVIIVLGVRVTLVTFFHWKEVTTAFHTRGLMAALAFILAALIYWFLGLFMD